MARCFVEATAARGGIQIPGSSCVPMAWPRSDRALGLLLGRGQVALCGFCLAEVRSRSGASAWPRSGRALWLLRGRGQVVLCGFCVAEVMSRSGASAWPRSVCLAEVRSSSVASPASSVPCTVSSGSRGSYKFEAGCFARLRSEWGLFFFCSPVQFLFFQLSTAEVASLSVERLAHLIVAAVSSAAVSIDCFLAMACVHRLWSCCFSPDCCVPFLVAPSALFCASSVTSVF